MSLDAMKQALAALNDYEPNEAHKVATALRAAIEQAQEPVAWMTHTKDFMPLFHKTRKGALNWDTQPIPLYTTPRQWQGLTDDEMKAPIQRAMQHFGYDPTQYNLGGAATIWFLGLVREIETKLKDKNT